MFDDTGQNHPESRATLEYQQSALIDGRRHAQMFPNRTVELPLPEGFKRLQTDRGVFHYNPKELSKWDVRKAALNRRENEILCLGPFNKDDISQRLAKGEELTCISEYTPKWVEVRTAAATKSTLKEQLTYFNSTKDVGNYIICGALPDRIKLGGLVK